VARDAVATRRGLPHIPLPFKDVMTAVLKVKPPEKPKAKRKGQKAK
jgi:hypothetical protein